MALKTTLDTNCFFDYFDRDPRHIQELLDLQTLGKIEIAMTTRVKADTLYKRKKGSSTSQIWEKILTLPEIKTIGSAFRIGISGIGSKDGLVSEDEQSKLSQLKAIMKGAQIEDIDHLFGHMNKGRDIFITNDKHFLAHKDELKITFGLVVLNPKDAVMRIRELTSPC